MNRSFLNPASFRHPNTYSPERKAKALFGRIAKEISGISWPKKTKIVLQLIALKI